jgi:murein DD-endopeptidase MepM/ murein hydrolase activator NlpD
MVAEALNVRSTGTVCLRSLVAAAALIVSGQAVAAEASPAAMDAPAPADVATASAPGDAEFKALFQTWKKLDTLEQTVIAIPSIQPVANLAITSNYGVRADPFLGTARMHAGLDIPGPVGTPIYATADGMVARAERASGYGNLVELNHGKGIETRYGHLSRILVAPNTRVKRGQLIALMGSTGRSTGSHLHYEVRIDGRAVNPLPYLQTNDVMVAQQARPLTTTPIAIGGPVASR